MERFPKIFSRKVLYFRCLAGFWICLWWLINIKTWFIFSKIRSFRPQIIYTITVLKVLQNSQQNTFSGILFFCFRARLATLLKLRFHCKQCLANIAKSWYSFSKTTFSWSTSRQQLLKDYWPKNSRDKIFGLTLRIFLYILLSQLIS